MNSCRRFKIGFNRAGACRRRRVGRTGTAIGLRSRGATPALPRSGQKRGRFSATTARSTGPAHREASTASAPGSFPRQACRRLPAAMHPPKPSRVGRHRHGGVPGHEDGPRYGTNHRDIVVIGGSSGAAAPLKTILGALAPDLPAAVFVRAARARPQPRPAGDRDGGGDPPAGRSGGRRRDGDSARHRHPRRAGSPSPPGGGGHPARARGPAREHGPAVDRSAVPLGRRRLRPPGDRHPPERAS